MRQILKPINSDSSSGSVGAEAMARLPQDTTKAAVVNSSIKIVSRHSSNGKVSACSNWNESFKTTTALVNGTCHGGNSAHHSGPFSQKENSCPSRMASPPFSPASTVTGKQAKCQNQRQSGMAVRDRANRSSAHNDRRQFQPNGSGRGCSEDKVHHRLMSSSSSASDGGGGCSQGLVPPRLKCLCVSVRASVRHLHAAAMFVVHQLVFVLGSRSSKATSSTRPPLLHHLRVSSDLALYLFVALIASLCYVNSLHGDFVHDDIPALVQNPDVLGTTSISELFTHDFWGAPMADPESHKSYRPITTLTFRINMALSVHPFGFHLANLALHTVVSLLVTRLTRRVLHFSPRLSLIATTLFATHPIHCEAVSSIVGRADVLCALFYLLSFFAFHKSLQCTCLCASQARSLAYCILWSSLALFCKETGATVFGVCALYWVAIRLLPALAASFTHRSPQQTPSKCSVTALFLPIVAVTTSFAILLTLRLRILGGTMPLFSEQDNPASHSKSMLTRVLTYLYLAVFNVRLLLSPSHQAYDWQTGSIHLVHSLSDGRNVTTALLMAGLAVASYRLVRAHAAPLFTRLGSTSNSPNTSPVKMTISPVVPSTSVPPITFSSTHTLLVSLLFLVPPYIPASNLFLTVGFVVAERLLYIPSIGFVCLICTGISQLSHAARQNQSPSYRRCLLRTARMAELVFACLTLIFAAKTLQQNKVWNSRETLYRSGIVNVPSNAKAHYNFANLQRDTGNFEDAVHHYQTAIGLWPEHASAHNNLGALLWRLSLPEAAERHFATALKINPYHAKAHFNLGKVYSDRGHLREAISLMERSIRLDSRFAEPYEALAAQYAQLGQMAIAERLHRKAIRLRPRHADFYNNYGAFLQRTGRLEYAVRQYQKALQLKPEHRIALLNVANALTALQRYKQAEQFVKRALRLNEDPVTLDSLGALFMRQSKLALARHVYEYIWQHYFGTDSHSRQDNGKWTVNAKTNADQRDSSVETMLATANIRIHYAQLLILEGRYADAEVLLEALTRLEQQQNEAGMDSAGEEDFSGPTRGGQEQRRQQPESWTRRSGQSHSILVETSPSTKVDSPRQNHHRHRTNSEDGLLHWLSSSEQSTFVESDQHYSQTQKANITDSSAGGTRKVTYRVASSVSTKAQIRREQESAISSGMADHYSHLFESNDTAVGGVAASTATILRSTLAAKMEQLNQSTTTTASKWPSTASSLATTASSIFRPATSSWSSSQLPSTSLSGKSVDGRTATTKPSIMNPFDTSSVRVGHSITGSRTGNRLPNNRETPSQPQHHRHTVHKGSHQLATILLLIDVHHQLALLYTLTNRSAEALDSVSNALVLCAISGGTEGLPSEKISAFSKSNSNGRSQTISPLVTQDSRCAQIYTLQGDIRKDLQQWPDAIKSYRQAIQLDECLGRPHLNLAVIYHLEERYSEALVHYTQASQLDSAGAHSKLINDNMDKLRRQRQTMLASAKANQQRYHKSVTTSETTISNIQESSTTTASHQKCQTRAKALRASDNQSPNTTFDYNVKHSSFLADSDSATEGAFHSSSNNNGLFNVHTSILSSL